MRNGQQSYPLAIGGTLYVTTNDANVFAIDGPTGQDDLAAKAAEQRRLQELRRRREPWPRVLRRHALHPPARHEARRDRPKTGEVLGEVATEPGRAERDRQLRLLADERPDVRQQHARLRRRRLGARQPRLRDGVHAEPEAGVAVAVLDDPARPQSWRRGSRLVGGGPVWTPVTIDRTTNTVFFGTGCATPVYYPALRPGPNPRTGSLIAVDLRDGHMKWWRQLLPTTTSGSTTSRSRRSSTTRKIGGQTRRVVSVGTKEGTWFAFDARTGRPFHERVKVIDRVEHPPLKPGQPVTIFPGSIGGLNYSPAAFDPKTKFVFNAAAETAGVLIQDRLSPTQKKRKLLLGDVYLGPQNGNFGAPRRVEGPRLDQRDQRVDRPPRLEVQHARAGARRRDGRPPAGSASRVAATASCAPSTSQTGRSSGRSRPADRSRPGRRSSPPTGRSTSRSPSAARRRPRAAASRRSCRCSRSAGARPSRRSRSRRRSVEPPRVDGPRRQATTAAAPTRSVAAATTAARKARHR